MEKAMAPHSSTLAWKIPWTEEPGGLQSMGSLRVAHDWATSLSLFTFLHWRRKWHEMEGNGMKTDLFPSCGHCWVFQICWHIECSTSTASSFRIWNSSTGIPSPPLALFVVMLCKAHLTSHSRMSGSRWVIIPSWLCWSWRSFLYSSYDLAIPFLGIYPEKTIIQKNTRTPMFIAATFTITRTWLLNVYQQRNG